MNNKPMNTAVLEGFLAQWPSNAVEIIEGRAAANKVKTGAPNLDHPEVFDAITDFIVFINDLIAAGGYGERSRDEFLQSAWQSFWLRERVRNSKRNMLP